MTPEEEKKLLYQVDAIHKIAVDAFQMLSVMFELQTRLQSRVTNAEDAVLSTLQTLADAPTLDKVEVK